MKKVLSFTLIFALLLSLTATCAFAKDKGKLTDDECYRYSVINDAYVVLEECVEAPEVSSDTYTLPSEIDGYEVRVLGDGLFADVDVPAKKVVIPDTVMFIGKDAFSFHEFDFGEWGEIVDGDWDKVPDGAYSILEEVVIPASVLTIGDSAFEDCANMKKVTIPENVRSLGKRAFENCQNLKTATILSEHIGHLSEGLFSGCKNLNKLNLPDGFSGGGDTASLEGCPLKNTILPDSFEVYDQTELGLIYSYKTHKLEKIKGFTIKLSYTGKGSEDYFSIFNWAVEKNRKPIYYLPNENKTYKFKSGHAFHIKVDGKNLTGWKSDNPKAIKVDADGNVSFYRKGTAKLTAKTADGKTYTSTFKNTYGPKIYSSNANDAEWETIKVKKGTTENIYVSGKLKKVNNVYKNTKKAKIISKPSAETLKIKGLKKGTTFLKIRVNNRWFEICVEVK